MKIGIIGTAGCGKTTLFNALTGKRAQTGGASRKNNIGAVKVPDKRLVTLQKLTGRKRRVHAEILFSDVAGEFAKPSRENGLPPELANMMKPLDAFAIVIGEFPDYRAQKGAKFNPLHDAAEIESDLILADLVILENRLEKMKKEKAADNERLIIEKCKSWLEDDRPLRLIELNHSESTAISGYQFLSRKPVVFIRNVGEDAMGAESIELNGYASNHGAKLLAVSAKVEMEIAQIDEADKAEFLKAMCIKESALNRFIRASYDACSLSSFFTTGADSGSVDESRAWTIRRSATAFEAAGKIHSDLQRGFIRAEVIGYDDFISTGGFERAKSQGKMRLEGKEYIVQDGDIMTFRFNI